MDIYVNNDRIDFSLEEERTLGDVVKGIGTWLIKENFAIGEIAINGETLNMPIGSVDLDRLIDGISSLHITATSSVENQHQQLSTVFEFFGIFKMAVENEDASALKEVLAELSFVTPVLDTLLAASGNHQDSLSYSDSLLKLIDNSSDSDHVPQGDAKRALGNFIDNILDITKGRIRELSSPMEELKSTVGMLVELVPGLGEVSVLLQTGNDREAMNRVVLFTDLSAKLIRLYTPLKIHGIMDSEDVTIEGQSLRSYYMSTNEFLNELNEAFESNDSVLIGDLLEYEIAPKLEALSELLNGLSA